MGEFEAARKESMKRRRQDGEQGGNGDAAAQARSLRERFVDEDSYHAVLEKVATLRDSHPEKHQKIGGRAV